MSEKKPLRMEFWKIIGTKHISDGVDAKIQIPTFGKWKEYKAGKLIKESMARSFKDELEKIGVGAPPAVARIAMSRPAGPRTTVAWTPKEKTPWWKPTRGAKIGLGVTGAGMLIGSKLTEGKKK